MPYRLINSEVAQAMTTVNIALLNHKDPQTTMTGPELIAARANLAAARADHDTRRANLIANYELIAQRRDELIAARQAGDPVDQIEAQLAAALGDRNVLAAELLAAEEVLRDAHSAAVTDLGTAAAYSHLDRQTPVALLPVRLETRYFAEDADNFSLWVRIYPDIHVDDRQPLMSADEDAAARHYWTCRLAGGPDDDTTLAAWQQLCARFGEGRAVDLAATLDPFGRAGRFETGDDGPNPPPIPTPQVAPPGWADPARARALPDRWAITGYRGHHRVLLAFGGPVQPDPSLTPDMGAPGEELSGASEPGEVDAGIRWLTDFDEAEQMGMAVRVTVNKTIARSMDRLIAIGVRSSEDSASGAATLSSMLTAHASQSLHFVPPGSPTNNTATTRSDYRARLSDYSASHARFISNSATSHPTAYQDRTARALGIDGGVFRHALHADDRRDRDVEDMHTALWLSTFSALLRDHVEVPLGWDDLDLVRTLYVDHVRPAGALPILRVGPQPYGILPVMSLARWRSSSGISREQTMVNLLRSLQDVWQERVHTVPRVFDGDDPQRGLVEALSQAPTGEVIEGRHAYWEPLTKALEMQQRMTTFWAYVKAFLPQGPVDLYAQHGGARVTDRESAAFGHRVDTIDLGPPTPLVTNQLDKDIPLTENYIEALAQGASWSAVSDFEVPGSADRPVLYRLLAGAYIQQMYVDLDPWYHNPFVQALGRLGTLDVKTLETLCLSAVDSATYRLDAWISAVAGMRLAETRSGQATGVQLGGFGWVEGLEPPGTPPVPGAQVTDDPDSAGFIHLPSTGQATTAAVLHGAHLAHADQGAAETLSMQLDSDRVRLAKWLLDGMRQGLSIGALLGYRLERLLLASDPGLGEHILELREAAPLRVTQDGVESAVVATANVVDGLELLRLADDDELVAAVGVDIAADVQPALDALALALDSVTDLLVAEGVHHTTSGNPSRAGAAFDAMAEGGGAVPEPDVLSTPSLGQPVGHRLMIVLPDSAVAGWPGDDARPRALAEPRLNAWAASLFGDPTQILFEATYTSADGTVVDRSHTLGEFDVCPLDVVQLSASEFGRAPLVSALGVLLTILGPDGDGLFDGTVEVRGSDSRAAAGTRQLDEIVSLADELAKVLRESRPLEQNDLHLGDVGGAVNAADLMARAADVDATFQTIRADFAAHSERPDRWWRAAMLTGAADPSTGNATDAVLASLAELAARHQAVDQSDPAELARLRILALLGEDFAVLPTFDVAEGVPLEASFADQASLLAGDASRAKRWLEDYARVRPACDAFDMVLTLGDVMGSTAGLEVAQLPHLDGSQWIAEHLPENGAAARVSLAALRPFAVDFGQDRVAGVLVDSWSDTVPVSEAVTGLTFHYDAPKTRAPQSVLVVPPLDPSRDWDFEDIEATVLETLDLAKIRGVEVDSLPGQGHYLPAIFFIQGMDEEWAV